MTCESLSQYGHTTFDVLLDILLSTRCTQGLEDLGLETIRFEHFELALRRGTRSAIMPHTGTPAAQWEDRDAQI